MKKNIFKKRAVIITGAILVLYLVLLIPEPAKKAVTGAGKKPFTWDRDDLWKTYEKNFLEARKAGCEKIKDRLDRAIADSGEILDRIENSPGAPGDAAFASLEEEMFKLAPLIGACHSRLPEYIELCGRVRRVVKHRSIHWDMNSEKSRSRIYRLLYGARAALEEVMLQVPAEKITNLVISENVSSKTPMASILGVNIYSGDILVSRGGAPTSALIARGNDYPGNFSHIALVHVDEKTHLASIIEAHIEKGTVAATLEDYLEDKKLRVMVLRLRPGLPALLKDPLIPHKAAGFALKEARGRHIPYDFEMDYNNHDKLFCSEVASAAYEGFGIHLWMGISTISSPALASWLAAFGVSRFETQEPSDLEYDPQLKVVAEWRDRETLYKDHLDNAVIDVMLEGAEKGDRLTYKWYLLPFARIMKGYSLVLNLFGAVGPVPEGMSASAALKNKEFSRKHAKIKEQLLIKAGAFKEKYGYTPPYWELIKLAGEVKEEIDKR